MAETRQQFFTRRSRQLNRLNKGDLCMLYRSLGGLGGTYPPEEWRKDEVISSVVDMEWRRLPADAKQAAPRFLQPPCDECGKGPDVSAHRADGSHNYQYTASDKPWVPARDLCAMPTPEPCGRSYEEHEAFDYGHRYQAPAEVQPAPPAGATAQHKPVSVVEALTETITDMGTELFRNSGPIAPRPYTDGPPLPYGRVSVPCLGEQCTGCSDPQCWTVRADGGDS